MSQKGFVRYKTIFKAIGGGFSSPGKAEVVKVGKHKVYVSRSQRLNKYGNPVHTVRVVRSNGSFGPEVKTSGPAHIAVSQALRKEGIDTVYPRNPHRRKRG